jgi:ribonuclease P protein component
MAQAVPSVQERALKQSKSPKGLAMSAIIISKISKTNDYKRIKEVAHKVHARLVLLQLAPRLSVKSGDVAATLPSNDEPRFGITVTKSLGNAVKRNKVKRRLRALLTQHLPHYGVIGYDYVCIARYKAADCSYQDLETDLRYTLQKAKQHVRTSSSSH